MLFLTSLSLQTDPGCWAALAMSTGLTCVPSSVCILSILKAGTCVQTHLHACTRVRTCTHTHTHTRMRTHRQAGDMQKCPLTVSVALHPLFLPGREPLPYLGGWPGLACLPRPGPGHAFLLEELQGLLSDCSMLAQSWLSAGQQQSW